MREELTKRQNSTDEESFLILEAKEVEILTHTEAIETQLKQHQEVIQQKKLAIKNFEESRDNEQIKLSETKGQCTSLQALQQENSLYNEKASTWLKRHNMENNPRIISYLEVKKQWEQAAEVVLGEVLQAIYVEDLQNLVSSIKQLEKNRAILL